MTCAESLPPIAHPVQVGLVQRFVPLSSELLGKKYFESNREANLVLQSDRELHFMNASYIGTFPTSASTFTSHSFTSPPQRLQE